MKIYIARHGKTNYNELGLCNADPSVDVHLTEAGLRQAEHVATLLRNADIDHIFISELKRTQQTADIINAFHTAPVSVDARLGDVRTGFEGEHHSLYESAIDQAADRYAARVNGGESLHDVRVRAAEFLIDLQSERHETVLIVTSKIIVQALVGVIDGLSMSETWDVPVEQGEYIARTL